MSVLKLQSVSVTLQGERRLQAVDFQLNAGEVAVIIGPNGAGKTTLLRALIGETALSSGQILVNDKPLSQWSGRERARQMAVLPQSSHLSFPYSVEEVVGLARMPHSSGSRADRHIVAQALAAMDLSHLSRRLYPQLSGGEKQRTQLARVLAQIWRAQDAPQRLLILDEPTASLDLGHQQQLMQTAREFAKQGVAVLIVMHDLNLAARFADTLLALSNGRVLAQGPVTSVLTNALLQQLFGVELEIIQHPYSGQPLLIF